MAVPSGCWCNGTVGVLRRFNDERSSFSNYGKTTVHLSAPGEWVMSTVISSATPDNAVDYKSGTSMATPVVSLPHGAPPARPGGWRVGGMLCCAMQRLRLCRPAPQPQPVLSPARPPAPPSATPAGRWRSSAYSGCLRQLPPCGNPQGHPAVHCGQDHRTGWRVNHGALAAPAERGPSCELRAPALPCCCGCLF